MGFLFRRRSRPSQTRAASAPTPASSASVSTRTPAQAQSAFCAQLPTLRAQAERMGWRRELEDEVDAIRQGRSALESFRNLMLDDTGTRRGDTPLSFADVWDSTPTDVGYQCPRGVCPIRDRNEDATEPWCHIEDQPMRPVAFPPEA
ncbi:hypothetical protein [Actinoallomurus acanthiterrae]